HRELVLATADVLFANGQATDQTIAATQQLARALGAPAEVMPRWGTIEVAFTGESGVAAVAAEPTGIDMDRVASTMQLVDEVAAGRLAPAAALRSIETIAKAPPAPTWLFALACGVGAVALAVIFGVGHVAAAALIFVSAVAGAFLRRGIARHSANVFL